MLDSSVSCTQSFSYELDESGNIHPGAEIIPVQVVDFFPDLPLFSDIFQNITTTQHSKWVSNLTGKAFESEIHSFVFFSFLFEC